MQSACERLFAVLRSDLDAVGGNKFGIGDPDEAEHPTQIRLQMFAHRRRRAGAIESAARDRHDHPLVPGQSFRAWSEGLSPANVLTVVVSPNYAADRLVYALGLGGTVWRRRAE